MGAILEKILNNKDRRRRSIAWLIDPDKYSPSTLSGLKDGGILPDIILVGGSLVMTDTDQAVADIKQTVGDAADVILFPGDYSQLTDKADALLMLSLVSGRNAEYLIGQQVKAAPHIKRFGLEPLPTGYVLIDGGKTTAVEYISDTRPIPADKPELAVATAMAAEMLGLRLIYLEAGSGAAANVNPQTVRAVRQAVSTPLIVGGGLRDTDTIKEVFDAGADIVVVGTAIEQNPSLAKEIMMLQK